MTGGECGIGNLGRGDRYPNPGGGLGKRKSGGEESKKIGEDLVHVTGSMHLAHV